PLEEARVVADDGRDRGLLRLVHVAGAQRGKQSGLRGRRSQEHEARRAGIRARGPHLRDVVDAAKRLVADRRGQPAILRARLKEQEIERCLVERGSHERPPGRGQGRRASRMAFQTRSAEAGMSRWRTPRGARASSTAFITTGSAPTVPASPAPLAPSGLSFVGTGWLSTTTSGSVSARGSA